MKKRAHECLGRLAKIEALILSSLDVDIMTVLNDEQLIENLTQSSYTSKKVTQTLHQITRTGAALDASRR